MSGGVGVEARGDTAALARAVDEGLAARDAVAVERSNLEELRHRVQVRCGDRAVGGDGPDQLDQLVRAMAKTDGLIAGVRRALLEADGSPGWATVPWLNADSDSWVVGVTRLVTSPSSGPDFVRRLIDESAGVAAVLGHTELTTAGQLQLLTTDPARFVDNWRRFGAGVVDGTSAGAAALAGMAAVLAPGADEVSQRTIGRRLGAETERSILDSIATLVVDPDAFVEAMIGWEAAGRDPYRWSGTLLPDLAAEAATAAVPASAILRPLGPAPLNLRPLRRPPLASRSLVGSAADSPFPELARYRLLEAEWGPADPVTTPRQGVLEPPEGWVAALNGDGIDAPGRGRNCVDCARATEANWRGQDATAAPLADVDLLGVPVDRLETWSGGRFVPASLAEIADELLELGPGSSALVASAWSHGGAHAYNAVNDGGVVKWIDAQVGRTSPWPPPYANDVDASLVIYVDASGSPTTRAGAVDE